MEVKSAEKEYCDSCGKFLKVITKPIYSCDYCGNQYDSEDHLKMNLFHDSKPTITPTFCSLQCLFHYIQSILTNDDRVEPFFIFPDVRMDDSKTGITAFSNYLTLSLLVNNITKKEKEQTNCLKCGHIHTYCEFCNIVLNRKTSLEGAFYKPESSKFDNFYTCSWKCTFGMILSMTPEKCSDIKYIYMPKVSFKSRKECTKELLTIVEKVISTQK